MEWIGREHGAYEFGSRNAEGGKNKKVGAVFNRD